MDNAGYLMPIEDQDVKDRNGNSRQSQITAASTNQAHEMLNFHDVARGAYANTSVA